MKSKPLDQIEKEAETDLDLSRVDKIVDYSGITPSLYHKYLRQYRLVQAELEQAELMLKKKRLDRWLYYSGKAHPDEYDANPLPLKIMKSDVNRFIDADDVIIREVYIIKMLEIKKGVIYRYLEDISRRSYHINNMISALKFQNGEF